MNKSCVRGLKRKPQGFRALVALPEDPSSQHSQQAANNHLELQCQGI